MTEYECPKVSEMEIRLKNTCQAVEHHRSNHFRLLDEVKELRNEIASAGLLHSQQVEGLEADVLKYRDDIDVWKQCIADAKQEALKPVVWVKPTLTPRAGQYDLCREDTTAGFGGVLQIGGRGDLSLQLFREYMEERGIEVRVWKEPKCRHIMFPTMHDWDAEKHTMICRECGHDGGKPDKRCDTCNSGPSGSEICPMLLDASSCLDFRRKEPEHEWVYGIYKEYNHGKNVSRSGLFHAFHGTRYKNAGRSIEELIPLLTPRPAQGCNYPIGTPVFGVRKLTKGEILVQFSPIAYGAFRNGAYIRASQAREPERCIKYVLDLLTPTTPAKTLDDLPTVEVE